MERRTAPPLRVTERADYAVKSVLFLCLHRSEYLTASVIAEEFGMSKKMVGAVLWNLVAAGIVESRTGWHGGFRLAREPQDIPIRVLIEAAIYDGRARSLRTNDGLDPVNVSSSNHAKAAVVVAAFWRALDQRVQRELTAFTLADLAAERLPGSTG